MSGMRRGSLAVCLVLLAAGAGYAQAAGALTAPHRLEASIGAAFAGQVNAGGRSADLIKNQSPPTPYPLFVTSSVIAASPELDATLGVHLTRVLTVEAAFAYARPRLETRVSADVEGVPDVTARETLSRYIVGGTAVVHLTALTIGGRALPFAAAGAGYVRTLHEGSLLPEGGRSYHAGGGVKYAIAARPRGFVRAIGIRAEARVRWTQGGLDFADDEPLRRAVVGGASVVVGF